MPAQSLIGGILRGFNKTAATGRADAAAREEKQREREHSLLLHLATTSEDEGVADMAASALVESTLGGKRPKEGYFNRLIGGGPDAVNPAVANIMALIRGGGAGPAGSGGGAGGVAPSAPAGVAPPPRMGPPAQGTRGQLTQAPTSMGQTGASSPVLLQPPPVVAEMEGNPSKLPQMSMLQPPPKVNTPPDAGAAVEATQSPAGPVAAAATAGGPPAVGGPGMARPQPPPTVMDTLANQAQGRHIWMTPSQRQREASKIHAEGIDLDLTSSYNAAYRIAKASGMGEEEATQAARHKVGIGGESGTMQEGDVVLDPLSPTGASRVIWRNVDGKPQEVGRIPAPKPTTTDPNLAEGPVIADATSPTGWSQTLYNPKTGIKGGSLPAPPPPGQGARTLTPTGELNITEKLATGWKKSTEDLRTAQQQTAIIRAGAEEARRTGNMNAATEAVRKGFAKLTDVASAVREAEFLLGNVGQPLYRKFEGIMQRFTQGGINLTQADLDEYASVADEIVKAYDTMFLKGERQRLEKVAEKYNLAPELIFYDRTTGVAAPEAPWVQMVNPATGKPEEVHPDDVQKAVAAGWKKVGGE